MSTDPIRRQAWEDAVRKTLNDNAKKKSSEEYILLRSGQLVGAALMIFVKSSSLKNIKNVEGSVRKVGEVKGQQLDRCSMLTLGRLECLVWQVTKGL